MKKSAVKIVLVGVVLIAIVLWSLLSNYFRGNLNTESLSAEANKVAVSSQLSAPASAVAAVDPASNQAISQVASVPQASASAAVVDEDFAKSRFCRAQYQEFIRISDGTLLRAQLKKNPAFLDIRCFKLLNVKGIDPKSCFSNGFGGESVSNAICSSFLTYYKYMLTDYLNPAAANLKEIPDDILRAKVRTQFVDRDDHDAKLMEAMAEELYRRNPDELRNLKIYLQAKYLIAGTDFSETSALFPIVVKAYKMAPQDRETQQFMAYSMMTSDRGLARLTELSFLNDDYYQYYFYAWFHWKNKTDFEKTKLHLQTGASKSQKNKYMFAEMLKRISDSNIKFGDERVFALDLDPMPGWDM